jgi:hypothetical protein
VDIPAMALAADGYVAGTVVPESQVSAATRKLAENAQDPLRRPVSGAVVDLQVLDGLGAGQPGTFSAPVTITLSYTDNVPLGGDGIVDGSFPPVRARSLGIFWLEETRNVWVPLPSTVDEAARTVSAPAPHFTTFALMAQADLELSGAHAFPVPFTPGLGSSGITFTGLPQTGSVRVYAADGRLVRELSIPPGGQLVWDVTNASGEDAATGVYLYEISNGHSSVTGKLAVLR